MRWIAVTVFSLLFTTAAVAQQKNALSVFYSNASLYWNTGYGGQAEGGFGLAYSHAFSPAFSTELSISREHYTLTRPAAPVNGISTFSIVDVHTLPIDLTARYHFTTDSRWKPYAGLGLRSVNTQEVGGRYSGFNALRIDPVVSGGVVFQFRPRIGLTFDAKQQIGSGGSVSHSDPSLKVSAGFAWRF